MEQKTVAKQDIQKLLGKISEKKKVFAPADDPSGLGFAVYDPGSPIVLEYSNIKLSPKGIFFPQTETMCTFDFDTIEEITLPEDHIVVFGSRPCDARSLTFLDKIFSKENKDYEDPYYLIRRENSVIISQACKNPCTTCFCTSVEGGPADPTGSDIMVHDLDDVFLFQSHTKKGEELLKAYPDLFSAAGSSQIEEAEQNIKAAEEKMETIPLTKKELKETMDRFYDDVNWDELTPNCIGCGACTYLCPTCYCFDISDEERMYKGRRIRTWDSCQYAIFTKHASGHNPRHNKLQRLRQRFMHKFSYTVENTGDIFCVGCGRCIIHCPVNLDIRDIIRAFSEKRVEA